MNQIMRISVNNVVKSKFKGLVIIILLSFTMLVAVLSYGLSVSLPDALDEKTEELNTLSKIKVLSKDGNGHIALSMLDYISKLNGVKSVLPEYGISGLLESEPKKPLGFVGINGFDFDSVKFYGAEDFRNKNISGILLPDISYEFGGELLTLKDYIGKEIYITYEFIDDGKLVGKTIECGVMGVYKTTGVIEENPIYMSLDLFSGMLEDCARNVSEVISAYIYLDSAEETDSVIDKIKDLGLEPYYQTTLQEYIEALEGFVNSSLIFIGILIALSVVIIIQTILSNLRKRYEIIGVLKAYGYSNISICFMVWIEIFIYSIISVLASVVLIIVLKEKINNFFEMFLNTVQFDFNISVIAILIIIAIMVSVISAIIPIKRLKKLNVIDVLKSN